MTADDDANRPMPRDEMVGVGPGLRLRVRRWEAEAGNDRTSNVPWLLVHGLASNCRLWDDVGAALAAAGHPVAAVDLRGHGRSDKPDDGYEVATVAADVAALLDALGWERPAVAGQSWGGNVVLELARGPRPLAGVACIDGGWIHLADRFADWEHCAETLRPPALAGTHHNEIEGWLRRAHPDWPESGIEATMANFSVDDNGLVHPWLTLDRHLATLRGLWEHQPRTFYGEVAVRVLLVPALSGLAEADADKRRLVAEAARALPHPETEVFGPPADHDVHAQSPLRLAAVLSRFAAGHASLP